MRCIALALPAVLLLNGSRTAVVCGMVAFAVVFAGFGRQARLVAAGGFMVIVSGLFVAVPGIHRIHLKPLHGCRQRFLDHVADRQLRDGGGVLEPPPVARARGGDLPPRVLDSRRPVYLNLLLGGGLIGLGAQLVLFASAIASGVAAGRLAKDPGDRLLAFALLAGVCAGIVSWALFDVAAFAQAAGMLALLIGMSGAALRVLWADRDVVATSSADSVR